MSKTNANLNSRIPSSELTIVPLNEHHNLLLFNCSSLELNDFLKNDALADQNNLITRTSLCFWKDELTGYVALVADTIEAKAVIDGIERYKYSKYPAIKIARLAVDSRFERRGIGIYLVKIVMGQALSICSSIGCRYILVDSKEESTGFYEKYGFKIAEINKKKDFTPMYLNMQPIIAKMNLQKTD
jgi:GNAT superfamily N-acetyltransferase